MRITSSADGAFLMDVVLGGDICYWVTWVCAVGLVLLSCFCIMFYGE